MKKRTKIITEDKNATDNNSVVSEINPADPIVENATHSSEPPVAKTEQVSVAKPAPAAKPAEAAKSDTAGEESKLTAHTSAPDSAEAPTKEPLQSKADKPAKPTATSKSSAKKTEKAAIDTAADKTKTATKIPKTSDQPPTKTSGPAKLALVISLLALGISGFQYYQSLQGSSDQQLLIDSKITQLEQQLASTLATVNSSVSQTTSQVESSIAAVNSNLQQLQAASAEKSDDLQALQQRLTKSIQQVTASGLQQDSRKDWLLAEVEYLLRLANQRVLMENTPIGALALLESADQILLQTDDVSIFAVRKALAADIAALAAVPHVDQEGLYLKIDALSAQINQLRLVPVSDQKRLSNSINELATDAIDNTEQSSFSKVWESVSTELKELVVIRHRDEAVEPLLSTAQQAGLLQNLHIIFEQAQLALLQRQQTPYLRSIEKAEVIINSYFQAKDSTTSALLNGLQQLKAQQISVPIPSIAGSLNALKAYLKQAADLKAGEAG